MTRHGIFSRGGSTTIACALCLTCALLTVGDKVTATEPKVWELETRAEVLRGEARNVSITDTGALRIAPEFEAVFDAEQPYIWSSVSDNRGNIYLGTGHEGRIYRVAPDASGKMRGTLFFDSEELDVFALAVSPDGALYAGTSPDGRVYRIRENGKPEIFFDPPDKYIWALAVMPDGALAVGTGDVGKIYRVPTTGASLAPVAALLADTSETHVLSLVIDGRGRLIAGTDPGGLVLEVGKDGKLFALFDAPLRELRALVPAGDGSIYALAISDAAAGRASAAASVAATVTITGDGGASSVTNPDALSGETSIAATRSGAARMRGDVATARSALFRVMPDGGADTVWSSATVTAFALAAHGSEVMIGTNDRGRIYSVSNEGRTTLLVQASEGQISSLATSGTSVFAATSNAGKLFRLNPNRVSSSGSYESPIEDAKFTAEWGRMTWRGSGTVEMQTRTGNTETPDVTWSGWQAVAREVAGARVLSPRARFIQWRAIFGRAEVREDMGGSQTSSAPTNPSSPSPSAFIEGVRLIYLPRNVRPEVTMVSVLPPNVALQSLILPGPDATGDAANFVGSPTGTPATPPPPRRTFQRGALALQWQAEDGNSDGLEYAIFYRALDEATFRLLKDRVRENFYTVDAQALPDGRYVFRIVASDAPANPRDRALTGERTSEPVEIDNTSPVVRVLDAAVVSSTVVSSPVISSPSTGERRVRFLVEDATGSIRRADASINGQAWESVFPDDGIADSLAETYSIRIPPSAGAGETTVSLRAFDRSGNVGAARTVVRR